MKKEVKVIRFAIFCDCCGRQMMDVKGKPIYEDRIGRDEVEEGWYTDFNTHKDYCPKCWHIEERECEVDDEFKNVPYVVTKDGEEFEYEW